MSSSRTVQVTRVVSASPLLAVMGSAERAQLALRGEIGQAESAALCRRILGLADEGWRRLTLDLSRVVHWDYRCLPALHRLAQQLRARGGELRLVSPSQYVATVLRFGGLEGLVVEERDLPSRRRERGEGVGA